MAKTPKMPAFQRLNIPSIIWHLNAADLPTETDKLVLGCIGHLNDGTKLSFQFNEARKGYNCSITQSCVGTPDEKETVSFWGGDLEEALQQAWLALLVYECQEVGFEQCQADIKAHEKHAVGEMMKALGKK